MKLQYENYVVKAKNHAQCMLFLFASFVFAQVFAVQYERCMWCMRDMYLVHVV